MSKAYLYRREDNGCLVEVDFATMMEQKCGFITLPDGVEARRCVHLEIERDGRQKAAPVREIEKPIVSDALGFPQHQLAEFEQDRAKHGFGGVEFTPDPRVPEFYQVRISGKREYQRYLKHRQMHDRNSRNGGGQALSPELLERAAAIVKREKGES
jgi:hypothetical protein